MVDERLGEWEGVNEFVYAASHNAIERFSAYSMMETR